MDVKFVLLQECLESTVLGLKVVRSTVWLMTVQRKKKFNLVHSLRRQYIPFWEYFP